MCQELYVGMRVFNRRRFRKHPDTGRRSSVLNDEKEWIRQPAPNLRILDDELWASVQARQGELAGRPAAYARKPKRLLSGLLRCAVCGSAMTLNGSKYACSANRERGTCSNGKIIAAERVEHRVIEGIRTKLLSPEAIAKAVEVHREAAAAERREIVASRAPIARELAEIARKLERGEEMCLNEVISIADLKALTNSTRRVARSWSRSSQAWSSQRRSRLTLGRPPPTRVWRSGSPTPLNGRATTAKPCGGRFGP